MFVDQVTLHLEAGAGGNGVASVRREKFKPLGGPDGGNGGHGGDIILRVDGQETTLLHLRHSPHLRAEKGAPGAGDLQNGKRGEDLVVSVPAGTVVKDIEGNILADLVNLGAEYVAAAGGQGGYGNAALASRKRKAPGFALLGDIGEKRDLRLELKSVADVALVGFPSAGKSSLISSLSAARPKIADYPFTTLQPHLGVVEKGDMRYTIADVPGLIPGAAQGKGLGLEFLRHIERCAIILHVIDCATLENSRDPLSDLAAIEYELTEYSQQITYEPGIVPLSERPRAVVLNKADVPEAKELAQFVAGDIKQRGWPVFIVSAVSREGLDKLGYDLGIMVKRVREREEIVAATQPRPVLRPLDKRSAAINVQKQRQGDQEFYQIRGDKAERLVRQTDFSNDEAVGYLAERLAGLGIEKELARQGARAGDMVVIGPLEGGMIFDWEPSVLSVEENVAPRGEDSRLLQQMRPTRRERKAAYHQSMDAKEAARQELQQEREAGHWTNPEVESALD